MKQSALIINKILTGRNAYKWKKEMENKNQLTNLTTDNKNGNVFDKKNILKSKEHQMIKQLTLKFTIETSSIIISIKRN